MNGDQLRKTGRGIELLDARELCNLTYSLLVADIERNYYARVSAGAKFENEDDPLGEAVARFEERIGMREDPDAIALALHRRWLESRGIAWDDTPVGKGGGNWWEQDVDDFRDMSDLDKAAGKKTDTALTQDLRKVRENRSAVKETLDG